MPLMTLQSNLSWYGTPGFQAAQNVEQTRFNYDPGDLTVAVAPRGFDNAGFQSNAFMPRVSGNAFNINGQGTATRLSQLGEGTKFPIGPEGQTHQFDIKRTGFSLLSRYGDTFDNKSLKGLAATYTAASPIDDMYNKFKVRDEVYDPYGYAKTPFILKGIQKDGSSDPERWGIGMPGLNVPRGGITANAERTAADIERIGKFLIRPEGIAFIAKQNILRQMIPNIESSITIPTISGAVNKANPQRLYNPLNTMATVLGQSYGLRFRNFGLTPGDDGISKYEDVVVRNRGTEQSRVLNNRLVTLRQERYNSSLVQDLQSPYWKSISTLSGGPDSIGGLGGTLFTKSQVSLTPDTKELAIQPQYTYNTPYLYTHDNFNAYSNETVQETIDARDGKAEIAQYQSRPYYDLADIYSLINRTKKSLYQIGSEITNYTFSIKRGTTLPLTGLQAQLDFHKSEINKFGNATELKQVIRTYDTPYIGTRTDTGIAGDKIRSIEDENDLINPLKNITPTDSVANNAGGVEGTITAYKRLAYTDIRRITRNRKEGSGTIIDFKTGQNWSRNTLESKYGYKSYRFGKRSNQPDPINNDEANAIDLIDFSFTPSDGGAATTSGAIKFRAYIISLSDSFNPSWDEQQDQGRADPKIRYQSFSREISVSFKVVVHSKAELSTVYTKLGNLAKLTYPVYSGGFGGKYVRVTIGDLYKQAPMYVTNVSYSWDSETPWEIESGKQLPLYTDVDISLGWIGEKRPNYEDAKIYG